MGRLILLALHGCVAGILATNAIKLRRDRRRRVLPAVPPRISIIVPARNEAANLERLLPSLLRQQYASFEIVVYDDGSEDATWNVLQRYVGPQLRAIRGIGPPPGWLGKVHALYAATRDSTGDLFLFLDADTELNDPGALARLVERYSALPVGNALSGLTRLCGGGRLLVSMVPFAILSSLPLPLVGRLPHRTLSAMNGQCWMISRDLYRRLEPHLAHRNEVLEDVQIGRYLKSNGVIPHLVDLQDEVTVHMYDGYRSAWRGFRKNAYLIMGGNVYAFLATFLVFGGMFTATPAVGRWFVLSGIFLKAFSDRLARFPFWISLLAPVSYAMASVLQLDSAVSHWLGRVEWKSRPVQRTRSGSDGS